MLINIPDDIAPNERHRLLKLYPLVYALCLHDFNVSQASKWLGISARWVHVLLRTDKILKHMLGKVTPEDKAEIKANKVPDTDLWKVQRAQLISRFERSFDYIQMKESERQKVIANINRLYS